VSRKIHPAIRIYYPRCSQLTKPLKVPKISPAKITQPHRLVDPRSEWGSYHSKQPPIPALIPARAETSCCIRSRGCVRKQEPMFIRIVTRYANPTYHNLPISPLGSRIAVSPVVPQPPLMAGRLAHCSFPCSDCGLLGVEGEMMHISPEAGLGSSFRGFD
jgi:hypothetical protein